MKNSVKSGLLAGCALGAFAAAAQADELSALKAQLSSLQSRVNSIEAVGPATSAGVPNGANYVTFRRGSLEDKDGPVNHNFEEDRGFTVAITPTADLPAPVMEVSVSGYVKADFVYDTHNALGRSASPAAVSIGGGDSETFTAFANQSRFRIRSRSETAVGQIRTLIEGDFEGSGLGTESFRLRHAWGEWDLTPNLTLGAGQTWSTHYHFAGEIPTVDIGGLVGTSGFNASRSSQIQLKSSTGSVSWAIGLQNPRNDFLVTGATEDSRLPDLAAKANFDWLGGQVGISALVKEIRVDRNGNGGGVLQDSEFGWGLSAGIDMPIGHVVSVHATGSYGDGTSALSGSRGGGVALNAAGSKLRTIESYGFAAGVRLRLNFDSTINAAYSYAHQEDDAIINALLPGLSQTQQKINVNYMWRPVSRLRMGLEGIWAYQELQSGAEDDNLRLQFGTWFYF